MSSERVKRALKALLKQEDNRFCADCPQKKPTWASINLGVFLCLHCAGIHRDMGVHISKVRSVELDTWQPEWVKVMQKWGNRRANQYWEASMPPNYSGRPTEAEAQALSPKLKKFIRDKYEKKTWAAKTTAGIFDDNPNVNPNKLDKQQRNRNVPKQRRPKQRTAPEKKQVEKKPQAQEEEEEVDLFGSFQQQEQQPAGRVAAVEEKTQVTHNTKAANIMAMFQKNAQPGNPTNMYNMTNSQPLGGPVSNGMQPMNGGFPQQMMPVSGHQQGMQPMMQQGMQQPMQGYAANPFAQGMQRNGQAMPMQQAGTGAWPQQMRPMPNQQQMPQGGYTMPMQQQSGMPGNPTQMQAQSGQFQPFPMSPQGMQLQGGMMPGQRQQRQQMPVQSIQQSNQYDPFASLK